MCDLIVLVPDHCMSFFLIVCFILSTRGWSGGAMMLGKPGRLTNLDLGGARA